MDLHYKKIGAADFEDWLKLRVNVLRTVNELASDADMSEVETEIRRYYLDALESGEHVGYLAYDGSRTVGCGSICFYRVMPTYHNPSGKCAYLMNIYTSPEYRRRGIARGMLSLLVEEAEARGIRRITLEATAMGRPLYESYGFTAMPGEMELP